MDFFKFDGIKDEIKNILIYKIIVENIKNISVLSITVIPFVSLILFFFHEPKYKSVSKIRSSGAKSTNMAGALGLANRFGLNFESNIEKSYVYPAIIKSRKIARKVIYENVRGLGEREDMLLINKLLGSKKITKLNKDTCETIAINKLLKMVKVSEGKSDGINTISIISKDPILSYQINGKIILAVEDYQENFEKKNQKKTIDFINERIVETGNELEQAEDRVKNFLSRNRNYQNSPNLTTNLERLKRDVSILKGVMTSLKQELEKTKIEFLKDKNYVFILDDPEVPLSPFTRGYISKLLISIILINCLFLSIVIINQYLLERQK